MVSSVEEKMAMMTIAPPKKNEVMVMNKRMGTTNNQIRRMGVRRPIRRMGISY